MQRLKRLPAMWETWVRSLSQEDPLEKKMTTHSGILAWEIPWTDEPGGPQSTGHKELDTTEQLTLSHWLVAHYPVHVCVHDQFSLVTQSSPTLCDPMDCSTPGFPVLHHLLELAQIHIH